MSAREFPDGEQEEELTAATSWRSQVKQIELFNDFDDQNKLSVILSGKYGTIECAKACHLILKRRLAFS